MAPNTRQETPRLTVAALKQDVAMRYPGLDADGIKLRGLKRKHDNLARRRSDLKTQIDRLMDTLAAVPLSAELLQTLLKDGDKSKATEEAEQVIEESGVNVEGDLAQAQARDQDQDQAQTQDDQTGEVAEEEEAAEEDKEEEAAFIGNSGYLLM